jgi:hypothetical protein
MFNPATAEQIRRVAALLKVHPSIENEPAITAEMYRLLEQALLEAEASNHFRATPLSLVRRTSGTD